LGRIHDVSGTALVRVEVRRDGAVPVCRIFGELDASNVDPVLTRLVDSVVNESPGLVLDLAGATYIDSAGVRILFELARRLRTRRQELRISVPVDGIVRRVLVLTALADVVPLHDETEEAVAAVRERL
jgi:anti-anti-sigma factor